MELTQDTKPMSATDWLLTIFLEGLPLIGLVFLLIWSFGDNQPQERATYAKATLIWTLIGLGIAAFFFIIFGSAMLAAFSQMQ